MSNTIPSISQFPVFPHIPVDALLPHNVPLISAHDASAAINTEHLVKLIKNVCFVIILLFGVYFILHSHWGPLHTWFSTQPYRSYIPSVSFNSWKSLHFIFCTDGKRSLKGIRACNWSTAQLVQNCKAIQPLLKAHSRKVNRSMTQFRTDHSMEHGHFIGDLFISKYMGSLTH